jgi:DNA-binding MarR family transcriptional regulator
VEKLLICKQSSHKHSGVKKMSLSLSPRYRVLIQLLRTAESLWNSSRAFFARWELSPSQFNVLNLLHGEPEGLSQTELSRELLMHRSNLTGLIDRLERRGLVTRGKRPGDRRSHQVRLTAEGMELLRRVLPPYHRAAEQVWAGVPDRRARQLKSELEQVCARAEALGTKLQA